MIHPETHNVTEAHGPRPAGKPDECFYCYRPLNTPHSEDCVMRNRTVVLRVSFDIVKSVPESWDENQIEHHFGCEGGYCASNLLEILDTQADKGCACGIHHATDYIREATLDDEIGWYGNSPDLQEK